MEAAVIIATYNWPRALELALLGFVTQTDRRFRVVVADDGSGPETRAVIERIGAETGMQVAHVWHPDQGFRKSEILNRAILACHEPYLIFTDGDLIPRDDFVAAHLRHARPGHYLAGMTVRLPEAVSAAVTPEVVRAGRATDLSWLLRQRIPAGPSPDPVQSACVVQRPHGPDHHDTRPLARRQCLGVAERRARR